MLICIVESFLEILLIPLILSLTTGISAKNIRSLLAIMIFYVLNSYLLNIPKLYPVLDLFDSSWNWSGKIYAFLNSLIFYFFIKGDLEEFNYCRLDQAKNSIKENIFIVALLLVIVLVIRILFPLKMVVDFEVIGFQFLPGLEEEMAFRGIMLSLLISSNRQHLVIAKAKILILANFIISLVFGLNHAFILTNGWEFSFNIGYFFNTLIYGLIWGYITIRSRSILIPILSHNSINIAITLTSLVSR
jgi:membrane protease YdiL (CAAX protease family)